jgi:hypothetical protein
MQLTIVLSDPFKEQLLERLWLFVMWPMARVFNGGNLSSRVKLFDSETHSPFNHRAEKEEEKSLLPWDICLRNVRRLSACNKKGWSCELASKVQVKILELWNEFL